jgi:hypothetical protein
MATDISFKVARGARSSEPARLCRRLEPDMPRGDRPQLSQPLCDRALQKTKVYRLTTGMQAFFQKIPDLLPKTTFSGPKQSQYTAGYRIKFEV